MVHDLLLLANLGDTKASSVAIKLAIDLSKTAQHSYGERFIE